MSRRFRVASLAAFLLLALGGCLIVEEDPTDPGPGPGDPPPPAASVTCDQFDIFTQDCAGGCAPTWDCDLQYDSLPYADKVDLDMCSDCLVDNLANGICADCSDPGLGIDSCQAFMEQLLGIDCW